MARVELETTFATDGRTIPADARAIIRRARDTEIFDSVLLLAEARSWKVTCYSYKQLREKPTIEGEVVIFRPLTREPLIVGLKKLSDGRRYAMCLGKFDTTPVEEIVA